MEKDNQNLWLLAVLLLSQNKKLMEDIRPVLTFLEEHEQSLAALEKLFTAQAAKEAEKSENTENTSGHAREESQKEEMEPKEEKSPRSPFSGVANEEILNRIGAYFAANARKNT